MTQTTNDDDWWTEAKKAEIARDKERSAVMTAVADRVCHEEQLEIWASEITDALSMGDFFRDDLSHDDVLEIAHTLKREVKDIVTTAFAMKEVPHAI